MCGLVACISKKDTGFDYKDKQMFNQMLYADALRGEDSTGVFSVNKFGNLKMLKEATTAGVFMASKEYNEWVNDMYANARIVVGHNRSATRGATNDTNAHPFIEDHICLVHNGTLTSHKHLGNKEVDSHAICESLAKKGLEKTYHEIYGAFALIWYNAEEKKLYITRNSQRPLWVIQTDDADYIASEPDMLAWIYKRVHGKECKTAFFDVGKIYSWDVTNLSDGLSLEEVPKKAYVPLPPPVVVQKSQSTGGHGSTKPSVYKNYKLGQKLVFTHESNSIIGQQITFKGKTLDDEEMDVCGYVQIKTQTVDEVEDLLDNTEFFEATICGVSQKNGKYKLIVTDIVPAKIYESINGYMLTEQDLRNIAYTCHDCGTIIDPEEENGKFWVRVKNSEVKSLKCSYCTKHHPHIKKEDKCTTNESSSSHISEVQDQLHAYETFLDSEFRFPY